MTLHCPCGSSKTYAQCCGPFHKGEALPESALQLMRARYSAFAKGEFNFLRESIDPAELKDYDEAGIKEWSQKSKWLGLTIVKASENEVEFIAKFHFNNEDREHHEVAQFIKKNNRWYYQDGRLKGKTVRNEGKIGRNDPCPCGSGKKYKKCCMD